MKIKKFDSINVVPFIDIMLVLLVIVLTTATFIAKGEIPLDLPKSSATANSEKKESVAIYITKDNEVFINDTQIHNSDFKTIIHKYSSDTLFKINCDKEAKFDYFVSILDTFKNLNMSNIAIVTQK